jgi:hypothetical protein
VRPRNPRVYQCGGCIDHLDHQEARRHHRRRGLIIALAGCGSAPTPAGSGSAAAGGTVVDGFKPCLVSDNGGFNDKSFNESAKTAWTRLPQSWA